MFLMYGSVKPATTLSFVVFLICYLFIERTIASGTVSPGCTRDCTWNWMARNGTVNYQQCTVTRTGHFACINVPENSCEHKQGGCYANPFSDVIVDWQEDTENRRFNLKLSIEIPRDEYHWKLEGIVIHVFDYAANKGKCYHLNFGEQLSHQVFNDNPKMIFEYNCIGDFKPRGNYYLQVDATPMPPMDKNIEQWHQDIRVPRLNNTEFVDCKKPDDAIRWTADYVHITTWYGAFAVEFTVAPSACRFDEYIVYVKEIQGLVVNDQATGYKLVPSSDATEKIINGELKNVITLNFTDKKYVGHYQVHIRGFFNGGKLNVDNFRIMNVIDSPCKADPCQHGVCTAVEFTQNYSCSCDDHYVEHAGTCIDIEAPIFHGCKQLQPTISNVTALGQEMGTVFWKAPNATDNVRVANITASNRPGDMFHLGISQVTYTAVDDSGNEVFCSFYVIVQDIEAPSFLGCKQLQPNISNVTVLGQEMCAVFWEPPTATDNVGVVNITASNRPGDMFPLGISQVTYTAVDDSGNQAFCSFYVIVKDVEPPTFHGCKQLQPNISITALGQEMGAVFWKAPTATDNAGVLNITESNRPGDIFHLGKTQVTYTAVDDSGNKAFCSFYVIVKVEETTDTFPVAVIAGVAGGIFLLIFITIGCLGLQVYYRLKFRKSLKDNEGAHEHIIRFSNQEEKSV